MKKLLLLAVFGMAAKADLTIKLKAFGGMSHSGFKVELTDVGENFFRKDLSAKESDLEKIQEEKHSKISALFGASLGAQYCISHNVSGGLELGAFFSMAEHAPKDDSTIKGNFAMNPNTKKAFYFFAGPNVGYCMGKMSAHLGVDVLYTKLKMDVIGDSDPDVYTKHWGFGPKLSAEYAFTKSVGAFVSAGYFFFPGHKEAKAIDDKKIDHMYKVKHLNLFIATAGVSFNF